MAGYNFDSWKSNNACEAEAQGLLTAGRAAQALGVSRVALERAVRPHERHHVGGGYAFVAYYDLARLTTLDHEAVQREEARFVPRTLLSATVE